MSRPKKNSYTNPAFCQQSEFYGARCKSPPNSNRRQSPVGAHTVHILDTSIRSIQEEPLPPHPTQYNIAAEEHCDEEQEFYEEMIVDDRGAVQEKKFVIVHNQQQQQQQAPIDNRRYDYIPLQQRRERVASPPKVLYHEEVDASTGRLHRYATIPSDDELDEIEEQAAKEELELNNQRYALVPVEEIRNKSRYAVITQEDIAAAGRASPNRETQPLQQHQRVIPSPRRPPPNPVATQKLHELLTTPRKTVIQPSPNPMLRAQMSPISPIRTTRTPSMRAAAAPPRAQQKLNYALGASRQLQSLDKRHNTAIVAPICSSPVQNVVYNETTFSKQPPESPLDLSFKKPPARHSLAVAAFMMILCGCVTIGLCVYMMSYLGRNYYLDFATVAGFVCFLLGSLGFRSRHIYWLPNRNYLSGYFVLSVFSLLTCVGLLVLLVTQAKPGTPLADMTSGAVCGISGLSLLLASVGVLASYCCNVPPPDNRVEHCAPGFNV